MELITRTANNNYLQTTQAMGLPYRMIENTTLNEKFDIQQGVAPPANQVPTIRYFSIGNGGHTLSVGGNGIPRPDRHQHRATDLALFKHLPFVLREPQYDLTPTERTKYALRREEVYNETRYIAYYLRRLDLASVLPEQNYVTVQSDGTTVVTPFVPDSSNLNPVPQALSPDGVNVVDGSYIACSARVTISMSPDDIKELSNVANIIYGDPEYGVVSEIGLVSGVDRRIQATNPGQGSFQFDEVIAAQLCHVISTFYSVVYSNAGFSLTLDVGATEPLYVLNNTVVGG